MELHIELTDMLPAVVPGAIPEPAAALDQQIVTVAEDPANAESASEPEAGDDRETMTPTVNEGTPTDTQISEIKAPAAAQADAEVGAISAGSSEPVAPVDPHHAEVNDTTTATIMEPPQMDMPVHPVCAMFPLMSEKELSDMTADIREKGLIDPIVMHEGEIVDGRHRLLACRAAGVEPRYEEWRERHPGSMTLAQWIWSKNAQRRQLTRDQILTIQMDVRAWEVQQQARERQTEGQKRGGETAGRGRPKADSSPTISSASNCAPAPAHDGDESQGQTEPEREHVGDVREQLATELDESQYRVHQAMNLKKADPAAYDDVKAGKTKLTQAVKRAKPTIEAMKSAKKKGSAKGGGKPVQNAKQTDDSIKLRKKTEEAITKAAKVIEGSYGTLSEPGEQEYFADELIGFIQSLRQ
jgi:hypothetical protein